MPIESMLFGSGNDVLHELCEEYRKNNIITKEDFANNKVKRGLRNSDGTGVMAGLTHICNVHGYIINDGDKIPDEGRLTYRGIDVADIINGCRNENRFSYEEVVWLLIFGHLPTKRQYDRICEILYENRELPEYFPEDVIMKNPSKNIMNKMARGVLTLYSYDGDPDNLSLENNMKQSIELIAKLPAMMSYAYQVKRRFYDKQSMFFHPFEKGHSTAESILNAIREDKKFTDEEARLLDLCMSLHAEHGGGNNSTFTARVLTSAETDIYSTMGAAIGSLKGFRHGGANHKVIEMMKDLMAGVHDWTSDDETEAYLEKILRGEAGDHSGLIYGIGHAVYTKSDPRAVILKEQAKKLAAKKGDFAERFDFYERIERLAPTAFLNVKGSNKVVSANVDFYSGLVYEMLGIPEDLFTPLFAVARIAGWCAHRIEELETGGRIMRPAYRALPGKTEYIPLDERV